MDYDIKEPKLASKGQERIVVGYMNTEIKRFLLPPWGGFWGLGYYRPSVACR